MVLGELVDRHDDVVKDLGFLVVYVFGLVCVYVLRAHQIKQVRRLHTRRLLPEVRAVLRRVLFALRWLVVLLLLEPFDEEPVVQGRCLGHRNDMLQVNLRIILFE